MSRQQRGFTIVEMVILVAVLGIITIVATPLLLNMVQAQQLKGSAQNVTTVLGQARQLAISRNTSYTVNVNAGANTVQFTSAAGTWTGPGTDTTGNWQLDSQSPLTASSAATLVFNSLGAATTSGLLRVRNVSSGACLDIVVTSAGRIRIASPGGCP